MTQFLYDAVEELRLGDTDSNIVRNARDLQERVEKTFEGVRFGCNETAHEGVQTFGFQQLVFNSCSLILQPVFDMSKLNINISLVPMTAYQERIASKARTWKYGSVKSCKYIWRPLCCQSKIRQLFPALARSQKMGRANCLSGECESMTRFKLGMIPA